MEMLNYPKTEYLLEGSLEALHDQSVAWMNELEFWGDEMSFFFTLLHKSKLSNAFPSQELAEIDKKLVQLNGEKLDKLKADVSSHERLLASVFKSTSLVDEQVYRDVHVKLSADMHNLDTEIRNFKKDVFSFIEK